MWAPGSLGLDTRQSLRGSGKTILFCVPPMVEIYNSVSSLNDHVPCYVSKKICKLLRLTVSDTFREAGAHVRVSPIPLKL